MPFYHAIIRSGLLDATAREDFAGDVVDIHCGVTGAPRSFVHVLVSEDDRGTLRDDQNARVSGTIRAGRTPDQKAEIATRVSAALAARGEVGATTITTSTRDIDASYTMEGGALLPEPGSPEEQAWKALA